MTPLGRTGRPSRSGRRTRICACGWPSCCSRPGRPRGRCRTCSNWRSRIPRSPRCGRRWAASPTKRATSARPRRASSAPWRFATTATPGSTWVWSASGWGTGWARSVPSSGRPAPREQGAGRRGDRQAQNIGPGGPAGPRAPAGTVPDTITTTQTAVAVHSRKLVCRLGSCVRLTPSPWLGKRVGVRVALRPEHIGTYQARPSPCPLPSGERDREPVTALGRAAGELSRCRAGRRMAHRTARAGVPPRPCPRRQLDVAAQLLRHVVQVALVPARAGYRLDAGPVGRQHLLLDAADRQHLAAQRDLAGHRQVAAHRAASPARPAPSASSRRPTARPSGWRPPGRAGGCSGPRRPPGRCRARRRWTARTTAPPGRSPASRRPACPVRISRSLAARHHGRLDEQHVAAGRRPGQARRHARALGPLGHLVDEPRAARGSWPRRRRVTAHRLGPCPRRSRAATLRHTVAISRSRFRTPASRVYPRMTARDGVLLDRQLLAGAGRGPRAASAPDSRRRSGPSPSSV